MKLDTKHVAYIDTVVKTAQLIGCDEVIIEPDRVRGSDEAKSVYILHTSQVPDMPFGTIGLNRLSVFNSRYEIARIQDNFVVEVQVGTTKMKNDDQELEDREIARALVMKGKGVKIDYRCANPGAIQAPRRIGDPLVARVQLDGEAVLMFQRGAAAMGAEHVTINSNNGVTFEFVDVNTDVFQYALAEEAESLDGSDATFVYRYPTKTLLTLFKHDPTAGFCIGQSGTLWIEINNLTVVVLPQA